MEIRKVSLLKREKNERPTIAEQESFKGTTQNQKIRVIKIPHPLFQIILRLFRSFQDVGVERYLRNVYIKMKPVIFQQH